MSKNHAKGFQQAVLKELAAYFLDGKLEKSYLIPMQMRPKNLTDEDIFRCCIYKERAILTMRIMAGMGFRIEEDDETMTLAQYARRALAREKLSGNTMTVIDIACHGCIKSRYFVTELCQGCLARSCMAKCPADAISMTKKKAVIDPDKCKNCGLCQKACPYQSIVQQAIPCEKACAVKAIQKNEHGRAEIDFEKCVSCGHCMTACPFGAIVECSQIVDILKSIASGRETVALIAPAIAGQFKGCFGQMIRALKMLGFSKVIEVAEGADETTRRETEELAERLHEGAPFMTTSCCPSYTELVKRHLPELKPFVSETRSPMHYTALKAKKENIGCATVFIGPCMAKRKEGFHDEAVDYVMTFEELQCLFAAKGINILEIEPEAGYEKNASRQGRGFPVAGGVAAAVSFASAAAGGNVRPCAVSGISPEEIKTLRQYAKGKCPGNLVEVMMCKDGCVNGTGAVLPPRMAVREIEKLKDESDDLSL